MEKKKKKTELWILLIFLAIAIFLITLWQLGTFDNLFTSTIPLETGTAYGTFYCQDEDFTSNSRCDVIGKMKCETQSDVGERRVIARIDDFDFSSGWIAYDNGFGGLDSYGLPSEVIGSRVNLGERNTQLSNALARDVYLNVNEGAIYIFKSTETGTRAVCTSSCVNENLIPSSYPYPSCGTDILLSSYKQTGCDRLSNTKAQACSTCQTGTHYKYTLSPGANINPLPVPGYENKEVYANESTYPYSCSGFFEIKDIEGRNLINPEPLACSGRQPCSDTYPYNGIPPGYIVTVTGGSTNEIIYTKTIIPECSQNDNLCDENNFGYTECNNGRLGEHVNCDTQLGYYCSNNVCAPPFGSVDIVLRDSLGNEKSGFSLDEPIRADVRIVHSFSPLDVDIQIRSGSPTGTIIQQGTINSLTSGSWGRISLGDLGSGNYFVTLEIDAGLINNIPYGRELNEQTNFRVSTPIILSIPVPYSPSTGTALYANSPIFIDLKAKKADGSPEEITNYSLNVRFNGARVNNPSYITPLPEDGLYRFVYQFDDSGNLDVTAKLFKLGVESNEESFSVQVKTPQIITKLTNIGLLRLIPPSQRTVKFETKNSFNELIDTENTVTIIPPGASTGSGDEDISGTVIQTDTGKYEFSYDFNEIGGYAIRIHSTAENYPSGDITGSGTITVEEGATPDECSTSFDCQSGFICSSGKCVEKDPPIVLYSVIGIAILFIIILIVLIVRLSKRNKAPSLGGEL